MYLFRTLSQNKQKVKFYTAQTKVVSLCWGGDLVTDLFLLKKSATPPRPPKADSGLQVSALFAKQKMRLEHKLTTFVCAGEET